MSPFGVHPASVVVRDHGRGLQHRIVGSGGLAHAEWGLGQFCGVSRECTDKQTATESAIRRDRGLMLNNCWLPEGEAAAESVLRPTMYTSPRWTTAAGTGRCGA
jgi:hypothetical protein